MDKIMIIDDEESILKSLQRSLRHKEDWEVEVYSSPEQALRRLQTSIFDVVIPDCTMPGITGLEFLQELKVLQPDAVRVLRTGMVNVETVMAGAHEAGAFRFSAKPSPDEERIASIEEGLALRRMIVATRMLAERVRDQQRELESLKNSISLQ